MSFGSRRSIGDSAVLLISGRNERAVWFGVVCTVELPDRAQAAHVEVGGAFYPVPLALLGQKLRARTDAHLVRVFHGDTLIAVHRRVAAGVFAPRPGEPEASTRQQAYVDRLVGHCERVGPALKQWADAALAARGVRAIRLIQGVLGLTGRHPRKRCVTVAHSLLRPSQPNFALSRWVQVVSNWAIW